MKKTKVHTPAGDQTIVLSTWEIYQRAKCGKRVKDNAYNFSHEKSRITCKIVLAMKQDRILSECMEKCMADGIAIKRSCIFDWTRLENSIYVRSEKPTACDATGAVLWVHGLAQPREGRLKDLCDILDVDTWWLWKFWTGFDRGYQMMIEDPEGKKPPRPDEDCKLGILLAKKYVDKGSGV